LGLAIAQAKKRLNFALQTAWEAGNPMNEKTWKNGDHTTFFSKSEPIFLEYSNYQ
jgi:hypothetical protein